MALATLGERSTDISTRQSVQVAKPEFLHRPPLEDLD